MSSFSGFRGVCAVALCQFTTEGAAIDNVDDLAPGLTVRWSGTALRLDGGMLAALLDRPMAPVADRARVRDRLNRLGLAPLLAPERDLALACPPRGFSVTDGRRSYAARLVEGSGGTLAVFDPILPLPDVDLWVNTVDLPPPARQPATLCGLVAGTHVQTPDGARPIEQLTTGQLVLTQDEGAQPILWRGDTTLSGAELYLFPHLRPVRLCAGALPGGPAHDLLAAPGLPVALDGLGDAFAQDQVLARAADLSDLPGVRRDFSAASVRYVHLLLPRPALILAEGLPVAAFHPQLADPVALGRHARGLERAAPGLTSQPDRMGPPPRQLLAAGLAAIAVHRLR